MVHHNKESEREPRLDGFTRSASALLIHFICVVFSVFIAVLSRPGSTLGLAAISYNKHLNGKPHFSSCTACSAWSRLVTRQTQTLPRSIRIGHLPAGQHEPDARLCSSWFTASVREHTWYLSALCPALSALIIMNQVTSAYMAKKQF
ncbi:hypothetical protein INR49_029626, partial [Caranx melampygus]